MTNKKISSVAREKKEMMKENFKKKGLPELLSEVNFSIDTNTQPRDVIKKLVSAVKRKLKKDFMSRTNQEKLKYLSTINIHPIYSFELVELESGTELTDYARRLLHQCQPKSLRQKNKESDVRAMKVVIKSGEDDETVGYTLLDSEITNSYHRTGRAFSNNRRFGYLKLFDISSLIAETIVTQSLFNFASKNDELVKYLFVEKYSTIDTWTGFAKLVPISEDFKKEYKEVANKHGFDLEGARESDAVESMKDVFYLDIAKLDTSYTPLRNSLLHLVVGEFVRESNYVQYKTNEELKERSDYAKAFQTKKHIKKSHQERMKDNAFLSRYGYVELDNDVDLDKFDIIEENFIELCDEMFIPKRDDYSFRIKKLGKHRAAGVFFPYYRATIFDLNHPDAFVHELYHQIDCIKAEGLGDDYFSETMEFRSIYDHYKRLVVNHIDSLADSHSFKAQWKGKTKYNSSYYLKPTEVFARCGEIYVAEKGIVNSLLKTKEELKQEHVYPMDEVFVKKLVKFYDSLTEEMSGETTSKDVSSNVPSNNNYQQLAFSI